MTVLTRWEPFREFSTLQDRMNRLFRESFNESGRDESLTTSTFAPAVDVYEDEHKVTLKIEVPGIDEKDIDVQVENNTLTVHGERKIEKEEKEENYRRVERQYGSFMWLDRQAAVAFELRHFPLYYDFTERMLVGLKKGWAANPNVQPRLIEEIDLTLKHIQENK